MTELQNDEVTESLSQGIREGHGKSSIASLFQSGAINITSR